MLKYLQRLFPFLGPKKPEIDIATVSTDSLLSGLDGDQFSGETRKAVAVPLAPRKASESYIRLEPDLPPRREPEPDVAPPAPRAIPAPPKAPAVDENKGWGNLF